ncbi:c-type cytochrome biogenesis protein CcmI [Rhizobacter sp. OV335]|uniref:c-type cytochrome biogenesis protein CcmI n=1 Tax=Rhizobacter sp. OV335 TaxID=1500264 RepID=UPI00090F5A0D|nr:c-type cytochrome biogenesis protein CcmI [Rhizobacter sp. OV335]SHM51852.1 cytochrome c-type biogenesis protein CcmH [Rhizobacter sp. OV335]
MATFLIAAALLVAATLLVLLRPWRRAAQAAESTARDANTAVYRDQLAELDRDLAAGTIGPADHEQARGELQKRLLADAGVAEPVIAPRASGRSTVIALALALPVLAAGLYAWRGNPAALNPPPPPAQRGEVTQQQIEQMIATIEARVEKNPNDSKAWMVLARSYRAMGRPADSAKAFGHVGSELLDRDPVMLTEYADVLATVANGDLQGKPLKLVQQALAVDPNNAMALSMSATAAYQRQDMKTATAQWQQLLPMLPPESDYAKFIVQTLAEIRGGTAGVAAGSASAPVAAAARASSPSTSAATKSSAGAATSVSGRVTLSPALASKVQPGDTVFVFARAPQGPRMPLAVKRGLVSDLPMDFVLDDSTAMSPEFKLSSVPEVRIEVRVSRNGSATPSAGDLIGQGSVVKPGATGVAVQIDQIRP